MDYQIRRNGIETIELFTGDKKITIEFEGELKHIAIIGVEKI